MLRIIKEKCSGCGICQNESPFGSIRLESGRPFVEENCVLCGVCVSICPEQAILMEANVAAETNAIKDYSGFWVLGEFDQSGNLCKVTLELLSQAKKLADKKGQDVSAVIINNTVPQKWEDEIKKTGCGHIILLECDGSRYNADLFAEAVVMAVQDKKPEVVLFPATVNGRDLAPRVACRLKTGLTADCTGLDLDEEGNLVQIRPTYGGSIMASIITPNHRPQMASIRPNVLQVACAHLPVEVVIEKLPVLSSERINRVKWIEQFKKEITYPDIAEAKVIITGGYGMGSKEGFEWIYKLSACLNAASGATRKAVDEGWAPIEIQIGQTGKTVAPDVYIACGVSGALQHTLGMKRSKKIIAINEDPAAPIFSMCDVAILGNASDVLKELYKSFAKESAST